MLRRICLRQLGFRCFSSASDVASSEPSTSAIPRSDHQNKFLLKPQAWLTDLSEKDEKLLNILDLHPDVFATVPRMDVLHKNIIWQQRYRTISYVKMLTRAEMPGGGKKPWPQTGIGRSRQGSVRSPHWISGGFAHGARGPKTAFYMLPLAERINGLCVALTIKHAQDDLVVVKDLDFPTDEPKVIEELADNRNWGYSILFVDDTDVAPTNLFLATQGLEGFNIMPVYGLNCLSIMKHDTLVLTLRALRRIEERLLHRLNAPESLLEPFVYKDRMRLNTDYYDEDEEEEFPPFV